jgi:hypothetical protein
MFHLDGGSSILQARHQPNIREKTADADHSIREWDVAGPCWEPDLR